MIINKAKGGQGRPACGDMEIPGDTDGSGGGQDRGKGAVSVK